MKLALAFILAATTIASADDKQVRLGTEVVTADKKVTEAQCMDKAKAALSAKFSTVVKTDHGYGGGKTGIAANIDCLQSYGASASYVSASTDSLSLDDFQALRTALRKAMQ